MNKLSKEKRDQLILVAMGTLVIVIGLWFGVISTQKDALALTLKRKTEAVDKLSRGQLYVKNASMVQSNLTVATERLNSLEAKMATGDLFSWIILTLDEFKKTHPVNFVDFQRERLQKFELMPDFPYTNAALFHVRVEAFYHDFGKFLADFENRFPHMLVQNLDINTPNLPDPTAPEKLSFEIDVVALIKPPTLP